jgi:hypothetical protein
LQFHQYEKGEWAFHQYEKRGVDNHLTCQSDFEFFSTYFFTTRVYRIVVFMSLPHQMLDITSLQDLAMQLHRLKKCPGILQKYSSRFKRSLPNDLPAAQM